MIVRATDDHADDIIRACENAPASWRVVAEISLEGQWVDAYPVQPDVVDGWRERFYHSCYFDPAPDMRRIDVMQQLTQWYRGEHARLHAKRHCQHCK